ncbi:MAG: Uma2 family endonuclease [Thiofilum sp.]|uniref:Uma2 family endonuclease n=1 Tax=Thiofilum sp. TaxID=2212733 RepID=UPI0025E6D236|nr:Uma2 family endonuclease [Thiofilum sp.]MBK8454587.1 Uma2 family endonuclease [Thiofilum sp.]
MSLATHHLLSIDDYLQGERLSEIRHEYVEGVAYAMAGASINHNQITANVLTELKTQLKGKNCRPFSSDLLVKTSATRYRYPDVTVVCHEQFLDDYTTDSPTLIVEVLSNGTRKTDRQIKRLEYMQIASLQEYMLIEQDFVQVEVFRRSQAWQPSYYYWTDAVELESLGVSLTVQAIYEQVNNAEVMQWLSTSRSE